jgi:Xaa-Pro aminopeptidase
VGWPADHAKLDRVRSLMGESGLDALVVRAPDNVVYLTDYWPMKGYDIVVFPREGDPILIVIEPQEDEARSGAWTDDVRPFAGYAADDPRPPTARALDACVEVLRERGLTGRLGAELTQGTQATDRMVGEPTAWSKDFFDRLESESDDLVDATGLLAAARGVKTSQEIERIRLANALAYDALEHVRERIEPGMPDSEVAALFEGYVHRVGVGYKGKVDMARAFTLVWSGPQIRTFTATGPAGSVVEGEPTLMEIWVCVDGYWTDLTKNLCVGPPTAEYDRLLDLLLGTLDEALEHAHAGEPLSELDRVIRASLDAGGYPGQPSHPIAHGVGARAHEPPYAHQAGGGALEPGMVLAIEPGVYWKGGGGLRLEDVFLIGDGRPEALCGFPDDFRVTA